MKTPTHLLGIIVKFLPPSNFRPARIKLTIPRFKNDSLIISFHEQEGRDLIDKAINYLIGAGVEISNYSDLHDFEMILINFNQIEKIKNVFKI